MDDNSPNSPNAPSASLVGLPRDRYAIQAAIRELRITYSSLEFNDKNKPEIKARLNALREELGLVHSTRPFDEPSFEALNAEYASPGDVPLDVRRWLAKTSNILSSDATDAVRWNRIVDTLEDDRYPSGELTIYRAVAEGDEIRPGDWATTDRAYARSHLLRYLNAEGVILEQRVDGRDVLVSPTGDANEAIYAPRHLSGPIETSGPTESPAFKDWIDGSKVVDAAGQPLLVYHGTNTEFTVFDAKKHGSGQGFSAQVPGFWFAEDQRVTPAFGSKQIAAFLSIKNPRRLTAREYLRRYLYEGKDPARFRRKMEKEGFDGLIISPDPEYADGRGPSGTEEWGQTNYIAFYPEQIKIVTSTNSNLDVAGTNISDGPFTDDQADNDSIEAPHG